MKFGAIFVVSCLCYFHVQSAEITENVDLLGLINVPSSSKEEFAIASDVFKQKYGDKIFKIFSPSHEDESKITEFSDSVVISDLQVARKIVEQFGTLITKVEVNFEHFHRESHPEIINQVNALESVVDLNLHKCRGNLFKKLSKPFASVKKLRLQGQLDTLKSETLQFSELFPALEVFDCAYFYTPDGKSIEQKMPHLKHFDVIFLESAFSEENIENLLKMNPQITSLNLRYNSPEFIKKVSEYLPNLEQVSFQLVKTNATDDSDSEEVHLKNVKGASISSGQSYLLGNLIFDNLEAIRLETLSTSGFGDPSSLSSSWIEFITKNKQLKTLKIDNGLVNGEQLSKLSAMENLTDINTGCDKDVSIETVVEFLKNTPKIKTAYFSNLDKSTQDSLREELKGEWKSLLFNRRGGRDVYFMHKN